MVNNIMTLAVSAFSLSVISEMDFSNLAAIDYAVLISTGAMWAVALLRNARRFAK